MADVYLVYAREDHGVAKKLFDLLSQRWDVWWDDLIVGDVARAIEREMPKARCALPLWSPISRDKTSTVIGKLRLAERHQVPIIPAMIEACDPPYGYDYLSYSDMRGWDGDVQHPGFLQLQQRIAQAAPPRVPAIQPSAIAGGKVPLPALFLSVSSHETQLLPSAAVE